MGNFIPQHLHHAIQSYACLLLDSEWNDDCIGFFRFTMTCFFIIILFLWCVIHYTSEWKNINNTIIVLYVTLWTTTISLIY